ncbi:MAG: hypothetical protein PHI67_10295 [Candidatus Methanomethylophilaceae archaeon]|jgi:hypothetical protein|nr:hypothetical protein [Candidatus Methanomethylophilaceae archaeon]
MTGSNLGALWMGCIPLVTSLRVRCRRRRSESARRKARPATSGGNACLYEVCIKAVMRRRGWEPDVKRSGEDETDLPFRNLDISRGRVFVSRILELNLFDNIVGDLHTVLLAVLEDPDGNIFRGPDDEQVILFNGSRKLFPLKAEPRFDQIFLIY